MKKYLPITAVSISLGVLVFLYALPFFLFGPHPLGYDTGFYRHYLLMPLVHTPNTPVPGLDHTVILPRVAIDFLRFVLPVSTDALLYVSYFAFIAGALLALIYVIKKLFGNRVAMIALALFALSAIQYQSYAFFLLKYFFALPFLLLFMLFLEEKKYLRALLAGVAVVLSHQTTAVILMATGGVYFLRCVWRTRSFPIDEFLVIGSIVGVYLMFHPHVEQKIEAPPVGIFLDVKMALLYLLPLIVIVAVRAKEMLKMMLAHDAIAAFVITVGSWEIFQLPFAARIWSYVDIAMIIMGAVALSGVLQEKLSTQKKRGFVVMGALFLLYSGLSLSHAIHANAPTIARQERLAIIDSARQAPTAQAIFTDASLAPWVMGWTSARVYAPGLMKDPVPVEMWSSYFARNISPERMFSQYPQPLSLVLSPEIKDKYIPANTPSSACLTPLSGAPDLYQFTCWGFAPAVIAVPTSVSTSTVPIWTGAATTTHD